MLGSRYLHLLLRCAVFRFSMALGDLLFKELSTHLTYTELRMLFPLGNWRRARVCIAEKFKPKSLPCISLVIVPLSHIRDFLTVFCC